MPYDGAVDADALINALRSNDAIELSLIGDYALIPATALKDFVAGNKTLIVKNGNGTYILPLSALNPDKLAQKLDVEIEDLFIKTTIAKAVGSTASGVKEAATRLGASVAVEPVDYDISAVDKDGKTASVDFGATYISRILPLDKEIDSAKATGVLYDTVSKKLSFVPTVFTTKEGKTEATLKRNGSSIYAVIELNKSFSDIVGHWAQNDIGLLANKLVVDGVTENLFEPDRSISRAEFAALVVRSLGLGEGAYSGAFTDVQADDWFAGVVGSAVQARIIDGYEDGSFRPNAPISREELAAMVIRAANFAGVKPELTAGQQSAMLAKFKDADQIVWARQEIAAAIYSGVVGGMTDDTIGPGLQATRAQSATMLKRFLKNAAFIN